MKKLLSIIACLFLSVTMMMAQKTVSGRVISGEDGEPIIGASVVATGTSAGTVTDIDGRFSLNVSESAKTLTVSYVGMETQTANISNRAMLITLVPNNEVLDEVMVVAYGTQSKQSVTGAISVINDKELEKRIGSNALGALEGATPGVQVNNTYGEPGSSPTIRIRGFASVTGSNSPLYVVDGVPFDGSIGTDLNPADIESMTILKDAASAALYGNRAANGIVLITTKKAKNANKPFVELSINRGWYTRGIEEYELLDADSWMEAEWLAKKNQKMSAGMSATEAATYATKNVVSESIGRNIYNAADDALFDANGKLTAKMLPGYTDLDWADAVERVGQRQEYNVSGGVNNDKYNIYASLGYLNEEGYIIATNLERYTGRINALFNPTKWLSAGINLTGSHSKQNYNSNANGSYYANPFYIARYTAPVYPMYEHNEDGSIVYDDFGDPVYDTTSPYLDNRHIVYEKKNDKENNVRNTFGIQGYTTFNLPYGFSATIKADMNNWTRNRTKYDNPNIGDGATNNGRFTSVAYIYKSYTAQELINWEHSYGASTISAMVGHENYGWDREYTQGMNTNMSIPGILVAGNFTTNSYFDGYADKDRTESYIGRARYNYNEKYFVEANFRRDGSSRFHKDNRWGNFYSFGASWNMKKESFLEDIEWINHMKFRASYGEVGNNAGSGLYGYMALYEIDKNAGDAALLKSSLSAEDVKWETTQTVDIGIEATFFNRLNLSLGYFDKRSKDLLFDVNLPLSAGSWSHGSGWNLTQLMNIGKISNRGIEISIDGDIVKTRDWRWNLGFDATFLKNEIKELYNHEGITHGSQKYEEGHSIYEWFTYHFEGVDQMTGKSIYTIDPEKVEDAKTGDAHVEINGKDYTTQVSFAERDFRGSALPKVYGAFKSSLAWKSLSLDMMFTYSLGGKVWDGGYAALMSVSESGNSGSSIHPDAFNKGWREVPAGMTETSANRIDPNGVPALDFTNSTYSNAGSDRWLTSGSYLVAKNINLSYSLPKALVRKADIDGASITFGVENLFTLTSRQGLNPQYSFSGGSDNTYVTARVFNLGLKLRF